jgi:hypothetical protein
VETQALISFMEVFIFMKIEASRDFVNSVRKSYFINKTKTYIFGIMTAFCLYKTLMHANLTGKASILRDCFNNIQED